jgi:hypothetical protein
LLARDGREVRWEDVAGAVLWCDEKRIKRRSLCLYIL